MADEKKIIIEIISKDESTSPVKSDGTVNTTVENAITPTESGKKEKNLIVSSVVANQSYEIMKSLVLQTINNSINKGFNLKENYMLENDYKIITSTINKASSLALSIAGGFAVGGIVGASVGGLGYIAGETLSLANSYSNYYQSLNATNQQTDFMRTRAGLIDSGRGTEN